MELAATISLLPFLLLTSAQEAATTIRVEENPVIEYHEGWGNCLLTVKDIGNRPERGYVRYQTRAYALAGRTGKSEKEMIEKWVELGRSYLGSEDVNTQCWVDYNEMAAYCDCSKFHGEQGHTSYVNEFQDVVNRWRDWSDGNDGDGSTGAGCDVNSRC